MDPNPRRRLGFEAGILALALVSNVAPAQAALRKAIEPDYTLLRRGPHSYVLGTGNRGWTVDVQDAASEGYRWGHVYGSLDSCLWIFEGSVPAGGAEVPDACRHPDRILPDADFSSAIYGGADDGADVFIVADAAVCPTWDGVHVVGYGNVRPWLARSAPTEPLQTQVSLGGQVKRRYLVRDGQFVMVRDPNLGAADGVGLQAWFFLPTACVTEAPPPPPPPPPDAATPPPPQSMPSGLLRPTPPRWPTPPGRPARTRRPTTPQTWRAQTPSPPQTRWTGPRAVTLAAKTSGPRRSV